MAAFGRLCCKSRCARVIQKFWTDRVVDNLATSDRVTIVVYRLPDGKMLVPSGTWGGERVGSRDQVLDVRNVDSRLHVARNERRHDEWDPRVEPFGPYAPGKGYDVIIDEDDASPVVSDASPVDE